MDTCLAATGSNRGVYIALIVLATLFGLIAIKFRSSVKYLVLMGGAVLMMGISSPMAYALTAQDCPAVSASDTSTGARGMPQRYNVLSNDTPSLGASFVMASFTLDLPTHPVAGSSVSSDGKTVTVPGEGTYIANNDGAIMFTPEATFVGTARGVRYTIRDTAGISVTNTYTPVVTQGTMACQVPDIQTQKLENRAISQTSHPFDSMTFSGPLRAMNSPGIDAVKYSPNGAHIVASDNQGYVRVSSDQGVTWKTSPWFGLESEMNHVAISNDGKYVVASRFGATVYFSSNGGTTWNTHEALDSLGNQQAVGMIDMSASGQYRVVAAGHSVLVSSDYGVSWQMRPATPLISNFKIVAMSENGQTMLSGYSDGPGPLVVSYDSGMTWVEKMSGYMWTAVAMSPDGMKMMAVGIDSVDDQEKLFVSDDNGVSWHQRTLPGNQIDTRSFAMSDDGSKLFVASKETDEQYISSDDGVSWAAVHNGSQAAVSGSLAHRLYLDDFNDTSYSTIYTSVDGGTTYQAHLIEQPINTSLVDLNPSMSGQQLELVNDAEGWRAEYDPTSDIVTLTVTNEAAFGQAASSTVIPYTLYVGGCGQPIAGTIYIQFDILS